GGNSGQVRPGTNRPITIGGPPFGTVCIAPAGDLLCSPDSGLTSGTWLSVRHVLPRNGRDGIDRVDAVALGGVAICQHSDEVVASVTMYPTLGVDLPTVDHGKAVLQCDCHPRRYTSGRPPILIGCDVLHQTQLVQA